MAKGANFCNVSCPQHFIQNIALINALYSSILSVLLLKFCQCVSLKSTLTSSFIPQIGHPKTRAFITHGGTNGIYEAIYHGIPMVGVPMFADQPDNIAHMKAKGAAVEVNMNTMTSTDLLNAVRAVINEPS